MSRRALALVLLVAAAVLAASGTAWARMPDWLRPASAADMDSTSFSGASTDTLIDSLVAPSGYQIGELIMHGTTTTLEKLLLGFIDSDGDTLAWAYCVKGGAGGSVGYPITYKLGCSKIYIKSGGSSSGNWAWECYYVR